MDSFKKCLVPDCDRDASSRSNGRKGYCSAHYQRVRIHGDANAYKKIAKPFVFKKCLVDGCELSANRINEGKKGYCAMHYQRFKRHGDPCVVKKTPSPAQDFIEKHKSYEGDGCLLWPFHIGEDGYGRMHEPKTGTLMNASRLMCIASHGEPPSATHEAAHTCGNGKNACVNPNHLYWATPAENQDDRVLHGTSNRGSAQWNSKLKPDDVIRIRKLLLTTSQIEIAAIYGVNQSTIANIKKRKSWAWLD